MNAAEVRVGDIVHVREPGNGHWCIEVNAVHVSGSEVWHESGHRVRVARGHVRFMGRTYNGNSVSAEFATDAPVLVFADWGAERAAYGEYRTVAASLGRVSS